MEKVLKIITKQEFTSLYRFGFLPKDPNRIIVEDESSDSFDDLFVERLLQLPYFSGDEEYLVIKVNETEEEKGTIEIENVIEVIPFTEAARVSYEQKFDSRIVFLPARFEDLITEAELRIDIDDKIRGAEALWTILNTDELTEHYVQKEDVEFALRARRNGQKSAEFQESFDVHLLAYDRYEFFPNTDLGYFYDVGEVFAHSMGKPTFKGSGLYHFLESIKEEKRETKLSKLIDFIEESEEVSAFKMKCMKGELKQYLVGVLFLMFKNELADAESIIETDIKTKADYVYEKKPYKEELSYAIYLTGLFFGYSKFYSDLYDHEGLRIFGRKFAYKKGLGGTVGVDTNKNIEKQEDLIRIHEKDEVGNETKIIEEEALSVSDKKISEIREQLLEILRNQSDADGKIKIIGSISQTGFG